MYILAVGGNYSGVVATVMSNLGFEKALNNKSIKLERMQVGDRYVLEGLQKTGYKLGGEQSGHIILPELLKTGDALLAAVQVVKAVQSSSKSLDQWRDEVVALPQAIVNIPLPDKKVLEDDKIQSFIDQQTDSLDGNGRILIRPSGTEPLARVMVEANDAQSLAESIAHSLEKLIKEME